MNESETPTDPTAPLPDAARARPATPSDGPPGTARRAWLRPLLVLAALALAVRLLPVGAWLQDAVSWVDGLGAWGPLVLVVVYVVACVLMLPGSVLTLGAGAVFGVGLGTLSVFVGATLGACAAFLVGRHLARARIEARLAGNARFAAIDRAVGREGLKIVLLTRLSPVFPFNLLNYAYGLTGVRFRDYLLGSVGMLPGTVMYVYAGAVGAQAASAVSTGGTDGLATGRQVFTVLGLVVTVLVTVFVTRVARRALRDAVEQDGADGVV